MASNSKPPVGVAPKDVFEYNLLSIKRERLLALKAAIERYLNANLEITLDWVIEYNQLTKELIKQ